MKMMNLANTITISRIGLLYLTVVMIYTQESPWLLVALVLSIIIIIMDAVDGFVARSRGEVTQFGGVLDITGDRIVENVYWIVFADLDLIPMWIPIIVMSRGFLTDAIRSQALTEGKTAFGENTMMTSDIGKFLVSGRFMRAFYGIIKGITFPYLILVLLAKEKHLIEADLTDYLWISSYTRSGGLFLAVLTTVVSVIRGIPVLTEGKGLFIKENNVA
ncbi:MAG: CDP-alcohol phosphatidyltransferase family protein [Bacteroidetes bacterium]|nr:CDP-alcohol phosphatidyltransferase family protein [Bacteroidota bacterium]